MFRDPKIQLALGSFVVFFLTWALLSLLLKVDPANPFIAFVSTATTTAWNMIMIFIKPDGGLPNALPSADVPPEKQEAEVK